MMNNFRIFNCSSCWEPQRTTCSSCQEEEPVQECGCNECNKCACSEPEIACGQEICCRPCWDTCKCMDEIKKLQDSCSEVHTALNNIDGRFTRDEKTIQDNYNYLSKLIGDLAEKEEQDIQNERNRAIGEEQRIENKLDVYINSNDAALAAEIARATAAETAIDGALQREVARAMAAEDEIDDALEREIARATGAETTINNSLVSEITRAMAAEQGLNNDIDALERKHNADIQDMNDHLDDIIGIDAAGVSEIKAVLSDNDTTTGIITELAKKADKSSMTPGSYTKVTVNGQGIVTAGSNPDTIAGYGITDAYTKSEVDGKTSNLQNAINSEAERAGNAESALSQNKADKANMTPGTYTKVTVNNQGIVTSGSNPTTLADYGITDARIDNGTIILGGTSITPITQQQDISGKANLSDVVTSVTQSGNNIIVTKGNGSSNTITLPTDQASQVANINQQLADIINRISVLEGLWTDNGSTLTAKNGRSVTGAGFYDSTI